MNEEFQSCTMQGRVFLDGVDIVERHTVLSLLRRRVGMVFQRPVPFPASIFDNVAFGVRLHGMASDASELQHIVQHSLESVGLQALLSKLHSHALKLPLE